MHTILVHSVLLALFCCGSAYAAYPDLSEPDLSELESEIEEDDEERFGYAFELDTEVLRENTHLKGEPNEVETIGPDVTLDLILEYRWNNWVGFLDYEFEKDLGFHSRIKDFYAGYEQENYVIRLGRQELPYAQSETEFIVGTFGEFAEISETALYGEVDAESGFGLAGYVFSSNVDTRDDDNQHDAGLLASFSAWDEFFYVGVEYITDLHEGQEFLGDVESSSILPRTPGVAARLYFTEEKWRLIAEYLGASDDIAAFEPEFDQPRTWLVEYHVKPIEGWLFGARYQQSSELEELPEQEYGVTARYWVDEYLSIGLEYLHGRFGRGVTNDDDVGISSLNTIAVEFTIEY